MNSLKFQHVDHLQHTHLSRSYADETGDSNSIFYVYDQFSVILLLYLDSFPRIID